MCDDTYKYQPEPGDSSAEGAYLRTPQDPSYYFKDANQYAAPQTVQVPSQAQQLNQVPDTGLASWINVTDAGYLKGALLGAGVALVVTNPKVQKSVINGAVKLWAAIQGGVEEIKEQVLDAKAELSREE